MSKFNALRLAEALHFYRLGFGLGCCSQTLQVEDLTVFLIIQAIQALVLQDVDIDRYD